MEIIYPSLYFGGALNEYSYWHPLYVSTKKINYFSNGDLLFTYYTNIANLQGDHSDLNLDSTRILVKTDSITDKTLWAKDIVYMYNGIMLIIADVDIDNDNVWWMLFAYSNAVYFTIIVKFDVNGNLINSFSAISSIDQASSINYYFTPEFLIAYDDWAFIFGETSYSQNLMGISANSQLDATLMKIDSNRNINWINSLDLNYLSEQTSSLYEQDGVLYLSFHSNKLYFWVCTVSSDDGEMINSSWLQTTRPVDYFEDGRFAILSINQKYIIGRDYSNSDVSMIKLIIYDTVSLKPLKFYYLFDSYMVNCISSIENSSKFIWTNKNGLSYSILTIDDQFNIIINLFKSTNQNFIIYYNLYNYILKANGRYYLSLTLNPLYLFRSLDSESVTYKFDNSMNSLTWESFYEVSAVKTKNHVLILNSNMRMWISDFV